MVENPDEDTLFNLFKLPTSHIHVRNAVHRIILLPTHCGIYLTLVPSVRNVKRLIR